MPGENCAFYGCSTSRKHKLSLFKLPSPREDESEETKTLKTNARQAWISLILRTRESTPELKKRIEANNIYLCELHFKPECFNICKYICIFCFLFVFIYTLENKGPFMNIHELVMHISVVLILSVCFVLRSQTKSLDNG